MSESENNNKEVKEVPIVESKEELKEITKKDLEEFSNQLKVAFDNINRRIESLEGMAIHTSKVMQPNIPQTPQQQEALNNPILQLLLSHAFRGEEGGSFGSSENKEFFAQVGKADFDSFRLMQQRRFMKLLEKVSKE